MENEIEKLKEQILVSAKEKTNWTPLIVIGLFFGVVWALNWYYAFTYFPKHGEFGDMFGASNALFSGLALAAVAYSLWLQQKELKEQRIVTMLSVQELMESRKAQNDSANALEEQITAIREQATAIDNQRSLQKVIANIDYRIALFNSEIIRAGYNHINPGKQASINNSLEKLNQMIDYMNKTID